MQSDISDSQGRDVNAPAGTPLVIQSLTCIACDVVKKTRINR